MASLRSVEGGLSFTPCLSPFIVNQKVGMIIVSNILLLNADIQNT